MVLGLIVQGDHRRRLVKPTDLELAIVAMLTAAIGITVASELLKALSAAA